MGYEKRFRRLRISTNFTNKNKHLKKGVDRPLFLLYIIIEVNKERENNMTNETVFIDADNGGVGVYIGAGNKVGFAKTAKMLKYILDTKKVNVFEDTIFFTSSMDFAHEEGFADQDGAKELFYTAQELIKDEIIANGEFA
jgi:hypothetical protein